MATQKPEDRRLTDNELEWISAATSRLQSRLTDHGERLTDIQRGALFGAIASAYCAGAGIRVNTAGRPLPPPPAPEEKGGGA